MPSTASRGWNPTPGQRPWPFRTTRNIVVTGLFALALVAALFGVGTSVTPPSGASGPSDRPAGLAGNSTASTTPSRDDPGTSSGGGGEGGSGSAARTDTVPGGGVAAGLGRHKKGGGL